MVGHNLKEFEVKDVEACRMVLRYLNLLEQGLTQDGYGDVLQLLEQSDKVSQHQVTDLYFPVKLHQDKGESLEDRRGRRVLNSCELL